MGISDELVQLAKVEIVKRSRLNGIEDVVDKIRDEEIEAAMLDAIDEINLFEPATTFTIEHILENDVRLKALFYLGAAKNLVKLMVYDFTANGVDLDLGDGVALQNRLGDYQSLLSIVNDEFDKRLERFKSSSVKLYKINAFSTRDVNIGGYYPLSRRLSIYRKSSRL